MDILKANKLDTVDPNTITPDMVRGSSLHDITARYGTLGLYTRLEDSLEREGLSDDPAIRWGVEFGLMLHADDRRSTGHYNDHIIRGIVRMIDHYGQKDRALVIGFALHDGVEDHAREIVYTLGGGEEIEDEPAARARAFELLADHVGEEPVELVRGVTNPLVQEGEDGNEVYVAHFKKVILPHPKKRLLKVVDFTDNGVGNHYTADSMREKLDRKYEPLFRLHKMGLYMPDSRLTGEVRDRVARQLTRGHIRTLARLAMTE